MLGRNTCSKPFIHEIQYVECLFLCSLSDHSGKLPVRSQVICSLSDHNGTLPVRTQAVCSLSDHSVIPAWTQVVCFLCYPGLNAGCMFTVWSQSYPCLNAGWMFLFFLRNVTFPKAGKCSTILTHWDWQVDQLAAYLSCRKTGSTNNQTIIQRQHNRISMIGIT